MERILILNKNPLVAYEFSRLLATEDQVCVASVNVRHPSGRQLAPDRRARVGSEAAGVDAVVVELPENDVHVMEVVESHVSTVVDLLITRGVGEDSVADQALQVTPELDVGRVDEDHSSRLEDAQTLICELLRVEDMLDEIQSNDQIYDRPVRALIRKGKTVLVSVCPDEDVPFLLRGKPTGLGDVHSVAFRKVVTESISEVTGRPSDVNQRTRPGKVLVEDQINSAVDATVTAGVRLEILRLGLADSDVLIELGERVHPQAILTRYHTANAEENSREVWYFYVFYIYVFASQIV